MPERADDVIRVENNMPETINVTIEVEYNAEEEGGIPARVWLYRLLNRINYTHPVSLIWFDGVEKVFSEEQEGQRVRDLALRDGVSELTE